MVNRGNGSITVFLSLVGIIIMALLGTLIETARFTICANHGRRCLQTAVRALMTEYSRPLYKNYDLFFIEDKGKPFQDVIGSYVGSSLQNKENKTGFNLFNKKYLDFYDGIMTNLNIKSKFYAGENLAYGLEKEINEFMKNNLPKELISLLTKRSSDFENANERSKELEEKIEEEKKLAKLDKDIICLIKKVDGISITSGKVRCEKEFIKMFVTKDKKSQTFGISHKKIWEKMKKNLDETCLNFSNYNSPKFKARLKRVLDLVKEAIGLGQKIQTNYKMIVNKSKDEYFESIVKNLACLNSNKLVLEKSLMILEDDKNSNKVNDLKKVWLDYDTSSLSFDYGGLDELKETEDPFKNISDSWDMGILSLVCEDTNTLSGKKIKREDYYSKLYESENQNDDSKKKLDSFVEKDSITDKEVKFYGGSCKAKNSPTSVFCIDAYVVKEFSSFINKLNKKDWKQGLNYQCEYILSGEKSDKKNLEALVNKILLIRTALNLPLLFKDEAKKAECYGLAAALVGFTGMEPLVRLTQVMILVLWAMVEGLVDVAGILQGRDVPVVKKEILTSFLELFLVNGPAISKRAKRFSKTGKQTFGYKEYLSLFLLSCPKELKLYRIMDLIENDMKRNGHIFFEMGKCVYGMEIEATFSFKSKFFSMQAISKNLNRKIGQMSYNCYLKESYI